MRLLWFWMDVVPQRYCKAFNREHAASAPSFFMVGEKGRGAIERECGKSIIRGVTEHNKRRPASFGTTVTRRQPLLTIEFFRTASHKLVF